MENGENVNWNSKMSAIFITIYFYVNIVYILKVLGQQLQKTKISMQISINYIQMYIAKVMLN